MTGWVIIVDQPKDFPNADTPHKVITTSDYLARPKLFAGAGRANNPKKPVLRGLLGAAGKAVAGGAGKWWLILIGAQGIGEYLTRSLLKHDTLRELSQLG